MRLMMPNVAVVTVVLLLIAAETALAASSGVVSGSSDFGGGGRYRVAVAATSAVADDDDVSQRDIEKNEKSPQTPSAVPCSNCLAQDRIKSLSIELIKASILNKLGMERPPDFDGRRPPRVPANLPPLQDLISKYNDERNSPVVVMPHIRHKSHHYDQYDSLVPEMQSDEAPAAEVVTTSLENRNNYYSGNDDDDDDYHLKRHKLMAFAQPRLNYFDIDGMTVNRFNNVISYNDPTTKKIQGQYVLYFTFSKQTSQHRITEAVLWLYKTQMNLVAQESTVVIDVQRINPSSSHQSPVNTLKVKREINTTEAGWVSIDLHKRLADWFRSADGITNLTLRVNASYLSKNFTGIKPPYVTDARSKNDITEIPYLVIRTENGRRSRSKRNVLGIDCNENTQETKCCRYPLTVDFEDFGWNWIIAPKKYEANYCSGECQPMFLQKYTHTHLTQFNNKTGIGPCCAPRKMSALSMLYFDQDMSIIYGLLPGMVVDRCGCS